MHQSRPLLACVLLALCAALPTPAQTNAQTNTRIDAGELAGMKARSIGPAAMSGRVADVAVVESDTDIVYVATASGGVWKSVNGGLTWAPVFDDQPVAATGSVAVFQPNPDIVWVGTGEGNPRNSVSIGGGVYKSLDGGRTWKFLGLAETERIHRVILHPTNPDVAWIAALGRLWGENAERGVFKTTDGGKTWRKVLYVDERTGAGELVLDPANPDKLFAALWDHRRQPWTFRSGGPGSGLYVSHDGGESWKRFSEDDGLPKGNLGRIGLDISRSDPRIVYALVEAEKSALLRSDDGGRTWKTVNDDPRTAERPFYYADIRVDPALPNRVYNLTSRLMVSNDSGKTFESLGGRLIHGDYHELWINPRDPEHLIAGEDGGLGISRDRGETWQFVSNLPLAQYYHVNVDMDVPYNIYGGLQDNGSWRGPSSVWETGGGIRNQHWDRIGGGDGFDTLPDPETSMAGYSMSQGGYLMRWDMRTGEQRVIRPAEVNATDVAERLRYNWNAGIAQDPFDAATIYYGSQYVHKSTDRGLTWTVISPDLTTDNPEWQRAESGGLTPDVTGAESFTTILAISPSPKQPGVLWVGTDDGRIHVTRDGGKTWESVEKNLRGVPANTWIPHIRASKLDPASAFVVLDNHRRSDFAPYAYRTDDWGRTWRSIVTPNIRGYALAIDQDPVDEDLLFLGTELGLYVSNDGGRGWMKWESGLPEAVSVMDLVVHPRDHDLVIATHGRSLYVLDDVAPLREITAETLREPLRLYPSSPGRLLRTPTPGGTGRGGGSGEFRGESRPPGALLTWSMNLPGLPLQDDDKERARKEKERAEAAKKPAPEEAAAAPGRQPGARLQEDPVVAPAAAEEPQEGGGKPEVEIRIADASGKLVRTMKAPARRGLNRAVWDLGRNPFRHPPVDSRGRPREEESGPEVPPGTYNVTLKFRGHEAKGTVQVVAGPHSASTAADWQAREAAIARLGEAQGAVVEAMDRVDAARKDLDVVLRKLEPKKDAARRTEEPPAGDPHADLRKAARDLRGKLTEIEKRLWVPPSTKGIVFDRTAMARLDEANEMVSSTLSAPSPTVLTTLGHAETAAKAVVADVNRLFAEDVAAFHQKVRDAGIGLLGVQEPIAVGAETQR